jgi:hypothetical protein
MWQPELPSGWSWFDTEAEPSGKPDELCRSAAACLTSVHGRHLMLHLQRTFLDRRVPPTASDAELRHAEGQRSVISHLLQLLEQGRGGNARAMSPLHDTEPSP